MTETTLRFGPEWLRALSNGGSGGAGDGAATSPPASPALAPHQSAPPPVPPALSYGREELLALFQTGAPAPDGMCQAVGATLFVERCQPPVAFSNATDEEQMAWHTGVNSDAVLRASGRGGGAGGGRGRGGGVSVDRGRGRGGRGGPAYGYRGGYEEGDDGSSAGGGRGGSSYMRGKSYEVEPRGGGGPGWDERNSGPDGAPPGRDNWRRVDDGGWRNRNSRGSERWAPRPGAAAGTGGGGGGGNSWRTSDGFRRRPWNGEQHQQEQPRRRDEQLENCDVDGSGGVGEFDSTGTFHGEWGDEERSAHQHKKEQSNSRDASGEAPAPPNNSARPKPPGTLVVSGDRVYANTPPVIKQPVASVSEPAAVRPVRVQPAAVRPVRVQPAQIPPGSAVPTAQAVSNSVGVRVAAPSEPQKPPSPVSEILSGMPTDVKSVSDGAGSTEGPDPATGRWYYTDPQNQVQGPFVSSEMLEWHRSGYFGPTLMVRRECDLVFTALGELEALWGRVPFTPGLTAPPITAARPTVSTAATVPDPLASQHHHHQMMLQQHMLIRQQAFQAELLKLQQTPEFLAQPASQQHQTLQQLVYNQQAIEMQLHGASAPTPAAAAAAAAAAQRMFRMPDPTAAAKMAAAASGMFRQDPLVAGKAHLPPPSSVATASDAASGMFRMSDPATTAATANPLQQLLQQMQQQQQPPLVPAAAPRSEQPVTTSSDTMRSLLEQLSRASVAAGGGSAGRQQLPGGLGAPVGMVPMPPRPTNSAAEVWSLADLEMKRAEEMRRVEHAIREQEQLREQRQREEEEHRRQQEEVKLRLQRELREAEELQRLEKIRLEEERRQFEEERQKLEEERRLQEKLRQENERVRLEEERLLQQKMCAEKERLRQEHDRIIQEKKREHEMIEEKRQEEERKKKEEADRVRVQEALKREKERVKAEKKSREEARKLEEEKKREEERLAREKQEEEEEDQRVRQLEAEMQQQQQAYQQRTHPAPPPSVPAWNTVDQPPREPQEPPQPLSLAEIQRLEDRQRREREHQKQLAAAVLQQEQLSAAEAAQRQRSGWATSTQLPTAAASLAEIQAEEQRALSQRQERQAVERRSQQEQMIAQQVQAGAWTAGGAAQTLSWKPPQQSPTSGSSGGGGFWESVSTTSAGSPAAASRKKQSGDSETTKSQKKGKQTRAEQTVMKLFKESTKQLAPDDEFHSWATKALEKLGSDVDVPTFIGFLKDVDSPYEVHDYARSYLGDGKEVKEFAKQFMERRSRWRNATKRIESEDNMCGPARAVNPAGSEFQEVKPKGRRNKNKNRTVDNSILGFSVTSSESRLNVGERETVN